MLIGRPAAFPSTGRRAPGGALCNALWPAVKQGDRKAREMKRGGSGHIEIGRNTLCMFQLLSRTISSKPRSCTGSAIGRAAISASSVSAARRPMASRGVRMLDRRGTM
ncbi:hypothetical protein SAMN05216577_11734 [Pseudomonas citronellolis]|uniref:Uncharacterized protein n=1 Tax=Pseudomonas citronellolis TaxID=53408 RepID=A0AAQ1HP91_9PSED|nr:hypothetical protein SAMN05216577_11734 [Pseudomonas citronellolis]